MSAGFLVQMGPRSSRFRPCALSSSLGTAPSILRKCTPHKLFCRSFQHSINNTLIYLSYYSLLRCTRPDYRLRFASVSFTSATMAAVHITRR
jgi:hypothetical protein